MVEIKPANPVGERSKDGSNGNAGLQKPLEPVTVLKKEVVSSVSLGERKQCDDSSLPPVSGDPPKGGAKPATEKRIVSNGAANPC